MNGQITRGEYAKSWLIYELEYGWRKRAELELVKKRVTVDVLAK